MTKVQRRLQRKGKQLGSVQKRTKVYYDKAMHAFFDYSRRHEVVLDGSPFDTDDKMIDYIQCCWDEGEAKALAANALSGIIHYIPPLRGNMAGSWRMISDWGIKELPAQAPPMHVVVMLALCEIATMDGNPGFACGLMMGFTCFLRTMEMFSLLLIILATLFL